MGIQHQHVGCFFSYHLKRHLPVFCYFKFDLGVGPQCLFEKHGIDAVVFNVKHSQWARAWGSIRRLRRGFIMVENSTSRLMPGRLAGVG